jgi:hypothetical protein
LILRAHRTAQRENGELPALHPNKPDELTAVSYGLPEIFRLAANNRNHELQLARQSIIY